MIEWIRLQNCQSWQDCIIHLASDRINIIKADNNIGKSVLFRILKLAGDPTYYDKEERNSLIRWGKPWAKVVFGFTDKSFAYMQIEKTKILYAYLPTGDSEVSIVLSPPIEMVNHIGLLASSDENFIANIIDMEQGLLLVNPKLSSNYDLVKMIATDENMDLLEERLDVVIREFSEKALRADDKKFFYEQQLSLTQYTDVDSLEALLELAKVTNKVLDTLARVQGYEQAIVTGLEVTERSENLLALVDFLSALENIHVEWQSPPISMNLWEVLRIVEKARFASNKVGVVRKRKIPLEWLDFALMFRRAAAKITVTAEEVNDGLLPVLVILEKVAKEAKRVQVVDGRELEKLEKQFRESGQLVECPVWGEVLWDGKNCVVVNQ